MRRIPIALCLTLWASVAHAQGPVPRPAIPTPVPAIVPSAVLDGPATVQAGQPIIIDAGLSVSAKPLKWKLVGPDQKKPIIATDSGSKVGNSLAIVKSAQAGTYFFVVQAYGDSGDDDDFSFKSVVVTTGPAPTPPPTPTPTPKPPPPGPTPAPPPVPVPSAGFRVLILYESGKALDRETLNVLNGTKLMGWLDANCTKGAGGLAGWRRWDKDVSFSERKVDEMKAARDAVGPSIKSYPCMVTFRDNVAEIYPFPPVVPSAQGGTRPATEDETILFLQDKKDGR